jgi:4,5-DOPA dioxygenase extradiol
MLVDRGFAALRHPHAAELATFDDLAHLAGAAGLAPHAHDETAAPTPDHFIPLLYLAGLPSAAGDTARVLIDGYAMGSLSMACYTIGCDDLVAGGDAGAPPLPRVPADETNN